jgi:hypothetical protein
MAITNASYYDGATPEIPSAGGDYGAPTPHAATADQQPFQAPTGDTAPSQGFAATDAIRITTPGGMSTVGQESAQAAFDAAGSQPQPTTPDIRVPINPLAT